MSQVPTFELVETVPDQRIYRCHSLLMQVQWREFRLEHFSAISRACAGVVDLHRQVSSIVVIRGNFDFAVPSEVRKAGAVLTKEWEPYNTGQAMVIEVEGFKGSVARSVLAGVNLLARAKAPQRVFKSPQDGMIWVCSLEAQPEPVRGRVADIWAAAEVLLRGLPMESPD